MTRSIPTFTLGFALTVSAMGCDKKEPESKPAPVAAKTPDTDAPKPAPEADAAPELDPQVKLAVELAKAIGDAPDKADDVLAAHKLDREGLDDLMFAIAEDPKLAASYALALSEAKAEDGAAPDAG